MPQPPTSANVDYDIVKAIAALYASQSDEEAEALYQQTSISMSARERLKLSHLIEEEILTLAKERVTKESQPQTPPTPPTPQPIAPFEIPTFFESHRKNHYEVAQDCCC